MEEILLEYPYKTRSGVMLAVTAFFGVGVAAMAHAAITNDSGVIVHGIFRFSVEGATTLYWCLAVVSMLCVVVAAIALAMNFNPRFVRLTRTELSFPPHGFARKPIVIALRDITLITTQAVEKQRFISIYYRTGASSESGEKKSSVAQSMLPNPEAFEKLSDALLANALLASRGRKNRQ